MELNDHADAQARTRRVLVVVFGATDLEPAGPHVPALTRTPGPFGHPQVQLRTWGHLSRRIEASVEEAIAAGLRTAVQEAGRQRDAATPN